MATSTRRERERAAVRDRIVAVALTILEEEGAAALTVRRIAGAVEYTAPVVYQHFANKDALLLAVIEVGHERLRGRLVAAAAAGGTATDRILDAGRAYLAFAGDSPHLYQLMNNTAVDARERYRAALPVTELVMTLFGEWAAENGVTGADPNEACDVVWGVMFGIASLSLVETVGPARAAHLGARALRALLLAWRTDPGGLLG